MTLLGLIIALAVVVVVGYAAYWVITKFFPEPLRMVSLVVVGVILLILLFGAVFPQIGGYRLWH